MRLLSIIVFTVVLISNTFGQTTPTTQVKTIDDLVALRIPTINNRLSALVTGRVTENDGGGGVFFYDGASAVSTNLGTVFKPAASAGRWLRQYSGDLNVKWFGATSSEATIPIQTAIDLAASGDALATSRGIGVFLPKGVYATTNQLVLTSGVRLYGESKESSIISNTGTTNNFIYFNALLNPTANQIVDILNLTLKGNGSYTSGAAIKLTSSDASSSFFINIENIRIDTCFNGLDIDHGQVGTVKNLEVRNAVGNGITTSSPTTALSFINCYPRGSGGHGFHINGGSFLSFISCASDSNSTNGFNIINTATNIKLIGCSAEGNGANGFSGTSLRAAMISMYILGGGAGSSNGIELDGGTDISIIDTLVEAGAGPPAGWTLSLTNTSGSYPVLTLIDSQLEAYALGTVSNPEKVGWLRGPKLGIGKVSPTYAAEIRTDSTSVYTAGSADQNPSIVARNDATETNGMATSIAFFVTGAQDSYIGAVRDTATADAADIFFSVRNGGSRREGMRLASNGRFITEYARTIRFESRAGPYTMGDLDHYMVPTATTTFTLPDASDSGAGRVLKIFSLAAVTTTIALSSGDSLVGSTTVAASTGAEFISDGVTTWHRQY